MAAHAEPPDKLSGHSRPIARMTPVILDQGRFDVRIPAWRSDRASQGILVGLLGVAFTAILLARPADPAGAGPLVVDPSPAPGSSAVPGASAIAEPTEPLASRTDPPASTDPAIASPAPSTVPEASPGSGATAQPTTSGETYRVKSGDTLIAIAARFGTTTQVLVRLNGIADPSKLKIGQILKLP